MKAQAFAKILAALADGMDGAGAPDAARTVRAVLPAFRRPVSVSELIDSAQTMAPHKSVDGGETLSSVVHALDAYSAFIASVATRAFRTDHGNFLTICRKHRDMSIRDFLAALNDAFRTPGEPYPAPGESLVDAFVRRLNETIHDSENFPIVFDALSRNTALKKAAVVEIASRFAFKMAKSTKREEALARIRRQHEASEGARAKDRVTQGKSAA